MKFYPLLASAVLHLLYPVCVTAEDVLQKYTIKTEIHRGSESIASPVLTISNGIEASIREGGNNGYEFDVTVTEYDSDSVLINSTFADEDSEINPSVLAKLGSSVILNVGDLKLTMTVEAD